MIYAALIVAFLLVAFLLGLAVGLYLLLRMVP